MVESLSDRSLRSQSECIRVDHIVHKYRQLWQPASYGKRWCRSIIVIDFADTERIWIRYRRQHIFLSLDANEWAQYRRADEQPYKNTHARRLSHRYVSIPFNRY